MVGRNLTPGDVVIERFNQEPKRSRKQLKITLELARRLRAFVNASGGKIAILLRPTQSDYDPYYLGLRQYGRRPQVRRLKNCPEGRVALGGRDAAEPLACR